MFLVNFLNKKMKTYIQHYPAKWNQGLESWGIYISKHSSRAMIYAINTYLEEESTTEYIAYFYIKHCNVFSEDPIGQFTVRSKASKRIAFKHFKKILTSLTEIYENNN